MLGHILDVVDRTRSDRLREAEGADVGVLIATIAAISAASNNRHLSRLSVTSNNFEDGYVSTGLTALFWRSRID